MKRHGIAAVVLFLAAFALYLRGAYPTVSAGDSGEFISAGHTLGIPHAPGFPAYILLAKTVQKAIPWGNIGYRTNLVSALCGALAVVVLFFAAGRLSIEPGLAFCAALLFMLSTAHRINAQASEVFALHVLLCALVLWAALSDHWTLAAFVTGWGLGNHQTILFLLPALGFVYFAKPSAERPPFLSLVLSGLGGLSVYAFLYIRAAASPVINGGDPDTLQRFWRVLTRADYGMLTLALGEVPARTLGSAGKHGMRFLRGLVDQITWVGVLLGAAGLTAGLHRQRAATVFLAAAFLFLGPVFFLMGNLPFNAQSTGLLERFYIAPVFCWMLLVVLGAQGLFQKKSWIGASMLLVPALLLGKGALATSFRHDFRAYAYGRNNLRTLPLQARLIMDGGDDTFYTLSYLRQVEQRRTDLALHDRGGVVFPGFYGSDFRLLTRDEKEARRRQVEHAVLAGRTPVYYSTMNEKILPDMTLAQEGILYRASGKASGVSLWPLYDFRGIAPWETSSLDRLKDYRTRALSPFYAYQRSVHAAAKRNWEDALGFASSARSVGPDVLWLVPNLLYNNYAWGQAQFQAGHLETAEKLYQLITVWDSGSSSAWSNLGTVKEKKQQLEEAVRCYQKAIELDPSSESAHYNLAVAYWKQSDWPHVIDAFRRVLAINPNNQAARNYLAQAEARVGRS